MIKLFKSVDEKLADIGFVKTIEDKYGCEYEREDKNTISHIKYLSVIKNLGVIYCNLTIPI